MKTRVDTLRAAVVGTGFIGVVHVDALRRLGVEVTGVAGSTRSARLRRGSLQSTSRTTRFSQTTGSTSST